MSIQTLPAIHDFLKRHSNHASSERPVAVFDCDGTVIQGDIGEAMLYHQLEEFQFRVSPATVWNDFPHREELDTLYKVLHNAAPGTRTNNPRFTSFADMILSWYFDQIAEGKIEKACADIVRLLAGYSLAEVRDIAESTFIREIESPVRDRALGRRTLPKGVRFIRESIDLLEKLKNLGFQIWVVSGSNKWSVEAVFRRLGIPADRVIGIELTSEHGTLSSKVKTPVPVRENKVHALQGHVSPAPLLVASDSDNDIPLFQYSADLKVLVNSRMRNIDEFFKMGKMERDETWVVIEKPTVETHSQASWQMSQ